MLCVAFETTVSLLLLFILNTVSELGDKNDLNNEKLIEIGSLMGVIILVQILSAILDNC